MSRAVRIIISNDPALLLFPFFFFFSSLIFRPVSRILFFSFSDYLIGS